jgi:hypothetical protein
MLVINPNKKELKPAMAAVAVTNDRCKSEGREEDSIRRIGDD